MHYSLNLEDKLRMYCAPTLLGLKSGSLLTVPCGDNRHKIDALISEISLLTNHLQENGVYIEILCSRPASCLLLVYHRQLLQQELAKEDIRAFLIEYGYPEGSLCQILDHLKFRTAQAGDFPHEIGIFLHYPLEDVIGFIKNKGRNYRLSRYWKVYGDVNRAQSLFCLYQRCRECLKCKATSLARESISILRQSLVSYPELPAA